METLLIEGNAAREILRVAEEQHCSLIVLGTHGRTGLSRVLLGSVAEDVIRHSRVPVLTLKTPFLLDSEIVRIGREPAPVRARRPGRSRLGACW